VVGSASAAAAHGRPRVERSSRHRRRLRGREYTTVKVFYEPEKLGAKLGGLGWEADVASAGSDLLYGTAKARTA